MRTGCATREVLYILRCSVGAAGEWGSSGDMRELTTVDKEGWKAELPLIREHFATFGSKLPKGLTDELTALERRLR